MMIRLVLSVAALAAGARSLGAQTGADSARTIAGVREYLQACRQDHGRLWGKSLCGPLIVVDGESGFSVATAAPPAGKFERRGELWIGKVPEGMQVANTATDWEGQRWSTVRFPLPDSAFARRQLLVHEAFHRIQSEIGLVAKDAINAHLDSRQGRYLLRLELRALARALADRSPTGKRAIADAALFRARRYQLFPGADSLENSLEIQEGLAEYTGAHAALVAYPRTGIANLVASQVRFESRPTFVRSLGYGTGPLLGLLLDRQVPGWRTKVRSAGFATQLYRPGLVPTDLAAEVTERAGRYDGEALAREEDARETARAQAIAAYRSRLVDGPVIVLAARGMSRSFNPNNLVPMDTLGTVYPTGTFGSEWGTLDITEGGALVSPTNTMVRVPVPPGLDSTARNLAGPGWTLRLNDGWILRSGPRPGDWTAVKAP